MDWLDGVGLKQIESVRAARADVGTGEKLMVEEE
jgi:hypothetical protein